MTEPDLRPLTLMLRARRFDEAVLRLAARGEIDGHYHVSQGLEASAAALGLSRRDGDLVATNYRNHAHLICLGHDPATMLAEILGRPVAPQFGRSGSLHLAAPDRGVLFTSAMVAGPLVHAVGYGLALKRKRQDNVSFCLFGDGAVQEGVVHESLNLAAIWGLPVVFVCENNANPVEGRANAYQSAQSLSALATAHRVETTIADGRRVRDTVRALDAAVKDTRASSRPRFVEVRSGPWPGNATFFPTDVTGPTQLLSDHGHADAWADRDDPVLQEVSALRADGVDDAQLRALDAETTVWINDALGRVRAVDESVQSLADIAGGDVWSEPR
jgi:pyruvate dehydrogenase E1 component alpha subunit